MPRIGRVVAPNMPHHVVQRGHNRNAVFVDDRDYSYYLDTLCEWTPKLRVKVYAWCLMTNHVHLLLDPGEDGKNIGLLMKRLAGRQTRHANKLENRTGSLWDGRYKMSIVDSDEYFLQCCRYIELNPVTANMVIRPENYRWSSYGENAGLLPSGIVNRHGFTEFGGVSFERYQEFVALGTPSYESDFISRRLESNRLTGGKKFVEEIELRTGFRLDYKLPGRPTKSKLVD